MREKINFAWPVTSENAVVYKGFQSKVEHMKEILNSRRIIIFGAGIRGCCLLHILEQHGYKNIVFCDNNMEKQGNLINDYDIISLEKALSGEYEKAFLISPENSDAMGKQLTESGLQEGIDWFSFDVSAYDSYLSEYIRPVTNHVLIMGDCAFSHIALTDKRTDSLGDMIKMELGENRCKVLAMHGFGQQAYYHIIRALLDRGEHPLTLLLLLVMEVLTPKAHIMPRTQHPSLIRSLVNVTQHPRVAFSEYAKLTEERFNRFQVESFASFQESSCNANERLYMKMNYLFKIREETEGIVYLKKTIRLLNDNNIPIVLYIPPVNYMQGKRFFGKDFMTKYVQNFKKLYGFLDAENLEYSVADASFLLSENEFAAANTIDETSNYAGRIKLLNFINNLQLFRPSLG